MSGLQRILSRVRIHGGDSGVSARATHHNVEKDLLITYVSALSSQADLGNVSRSTTERKKMSTKTTFKRIALVTVAAMGLGVLTSVAPASATQDVIVCNVADGKSSGTHGTLTDGACSGVAGPANTVQIKLDDTADASRLTVDGAGATFVATSDATNIKISTDGKSATVGTVADNVTVNVATPTVGTVTVSYFNEGAAGIYSATADEIVTVTVNAAASSGVFSAAKSGAVIKADITDSYSLSDLTTWSTSDTVVVAKGTSAVATVAIYTNDALGAAINSTVVGEMTGAGLFTLETTVALSAAATKTRYASKAQNDTGARVFTAGGNIDSGTAAKGVVYATVFGDGTAGTGTIKFSVGGVEVKSVSVTFSGEVKTITATQNLFVAVANTRLGATDAAGAASSTAVGDTYAVTLKAVDSASNAVTGITNWVATSSDATVMNSTASGSCTESSVTKGTYNCEVTGAASAVAGKTATITFSSLLADGVTKISAAPLTFAIGTVAPAKITLSLDKATYLPGEKVTLTLTATDALSNKSADSIGTAFLAAALDVSVQTSAAIFGTAVQVINGKATATFFAPLAGGKFTVAGKYGSSTAATVAGTALTSVEGNVSSAGDVAALTLLINSLIKKINALSTLVAKIQKKLGVK